MVEWILSEFSRRIYKVATNVACGESHSVSLCVVFQSFHIDPAVNF